MTGKNKTPLLGWHPPAELSAWVRKEAAAREISISALLNEIVQAYIDAPRIAERVYQYGYDASRSDNLQ